MRFIKFGFFLLVQFLLLGGICEGQTDGVVLHRPSPEALRKLQSEYLGRAITNTTLPVVANWGSDDLDYDDRHGVSSGPRVLSWYDQTNMSAFLRSLLPLVRSRDVSVDFPVGDLEAANFALQFSNVFVSAGLRVACGPSDHPFTTSNFAPSNGVFIVASGVGCARLGSYLLSAFAFSDVRVRYRYLGLGSPPDAIHVEVWTRP